MDITNKCTITGKMSTRFIKGLTEEMIFEWTDGVLIQEAMPTVSPEDREFIISGITPETWAEKFPAGPTMYYGDSGQGVEERFVQFGM